MLVHANRRSAVERKRGEGRAAGVQPGDAVLGGQKQGSKGGDASIQTIGSWVICILQVENELLWGAGAGGGGQGARQEREGRRADGIAGLDLVQERREGRRARREREGKELTAVLNLDAVQQRREGKEAS